MFDELSQLLQRRLDVITDHAWRDRDSVAHLAALAEVSEKIGAWTSCHRSQLDGRLRHYLDNSSYQKALDHLADLRGKKSTL